MRTVTRFFAVAVYSILGILNGCKDSSTSLNNKLPIVEMPKIPDYKGGKVYVSGYETNEANGYTEARIWVDGVTASFTPNSSTEYANGIALDGEDIYIVGSSSPINSNEDRATIWKNGELNVLENIKSFGNAIFLSEGNPFVAMHLNRGGSSVAAVWSEGEVTDLTDGTRLAAAKAVFVSGADVYLGGHQFNGTDKIEAKYWKNGQEVILPQVFNNSRVECLFVEGNDVHAAGWEWGGSYRVAVYWKNGIRSELEPRTNDSEVRAIQVVGDDVYMVGYVGRNPKYPRIWKNGVGINLLESPHAGEASAIAIEGSDVYVVGSQYIDGRSVAALWKNADLHLLGVAANGNKDSYATGVAIREAE